ncbi:unnamed protein product [Rhodiola kirilowii]
MFPSHSALADMVKWFSHLINTFASVPKVETVTLRPVHTIMGMPEDAVTSLPTTFLNLNSLTSLEIALHSQQCIFLILRILKSSLNLRELNFGIRQSATSEEDKAALHFHDMQTQNPRTLNNLLTIKMKGLLGSKVEIMFIQLILSCSPHLGNYVFDRRECSQRDKVHIDVRAIGVQTTFTPSSGDVLETSWGQLYI